MKSKSPSTRVIALALSLGLTVSGAGAVAEDGTSGLLPPTLTTCEIVPANWSAPVASPVASPGATPVVAASPVATPVVEADPLQADLETASQAILNCMSVNDVDTLTTITEGPFRASWLGLGTTVSDADFAAIVPMLPVLPYELVDITNATASGDTATATVRYTNGRQLHTAEWTFRLATVDGENVWKVSSQENQPTAALAEAAVINVTVADGSYTVDISAVPEGDIVLNVTNTGSTPHELLIVRAADGTEAADFAAAPTGIPDGSTFIGQVTVPPDAEGSIVLSDVRSGTYTVVDLLPDASGMPNVSSGMFTTFTVEQP